MGKHSKPQSPAKDIVILVIGLSGVGKSTFINSLLGNDHMAVGHGLDPCTKNLIAVEIAPWKDHRVFIVDTPGFNNTETNDLDIFKQMAAWLQKQWPGQPIDGGVIYLHNIQDDRYSTVASTDLSTMRDSFGQSKGTLQRIALATTKWHHSNTDESKERQLRLQEEKWKNLVDGGTRVMEFKRDPESARNIVDHLLQNCLDHPPEFDITATLGEVMKAHIGPPTPRFMRFLRSFGLFGRRFGH